MAVLIAGGVLVAALLVWALTRTVEPESVMSTDTGAATTTFTPPADTGGMVAAPPSAGTFATNDPTGTTPAPTTAAPPPQPEGDRGEVKRISAEDLKAQVNRGAVTVIDVRTAADYARGHIPGAINIPFASIETQFDTIPKGKPIVTYCT